MKGLYGVTRGTNGAILYNEAEHALSGGATLLQYRDKSKNTRKRLKDAATLRDICNRHRALLIINDDLQLAQSSHADGIHLGKGDGSITKARRTLGKSSIIGASCYNDLQLALDAEAQGASYVAFGSFFNSPTKPNAPQATIELLIEAKKQLSIPICCIGGITLDNAPLLINNGADMLAVISAIFAQDDIQQASYDFSALFNR